MKQNTLTNLIIATIFFLGAAGALGGAVWYLGEKQAELAMVQEEIAREQALQQRFNQLQATVAESEAERQALEALLFGEEETIQLLAQLEALAETLRLTFETTRLNLESVAESEEQQLELAWSVSGSKRSVQQFITAIENLPYMSEVTQLVLRDRTATTEDAGTFEAIGTLIITVGSYD